MSLVQLFRSIACVSCAFVVLSAQAQEQCDPHAFLQKDTDIAVLNTNSALSYLATTDRALDEKSTKSLLGKLGASVEGIPTSFSLDGSHARSIASRVRSQLKIDRTFSQDLFVLRQALSAAGVDAYVKCISAQPLTLTFGSDPTSSKRFSMKVDWRPQNAVEGGYKLAMSIQNGVFDDDGDSERTIERSIVPQGSIALSVTDRNVKEQTSIVVNIMSRSGNSIESQMIDVPAHVPVLLATELIKSARLKATAPGKRNDHRSASDCVTTTKPNAYFVPGTAVYHGDTDSRREFKWTTINPSVVCGKATAIPKNDTTAVVDGHFTVLQITYSSE